MSESWICTVCGTENLDNRDHCWKCSSVKGASSENQQPLSSQPAERKEPRVDVAPEQAGKQIKEIGASRELSKSEIDEKNTK